MVSIVTLESDSFEDIPQVEVYRPVTPKEISEKLSKKPFQIVADLMTFNYFSAINTELSDEIVDQLGEKYHITFKIINAA